MIITGHDGGGRVGRGEGVITRVGGVNLAAPHGAWCSLAVRRRSVGVRGAVHHTRVVGVGGVGWAWHEALVEERGLIEEQRLVGYV